VTYLLRTITILVLLYALAWMGFARIGPAERTPTQTVTTPSVPIQTDDGLDPVNLIFTGYAPSWWIAANIAGWSDSAYCSGPKTLNDHEYNYTLEHPDLNGIPCYGPRDHVRVWDMGYSPVFGEWSIGSAHHERTVCNPNCHHVVDSWDRAEADVRASFLGGSATLSVSNYSLANPGYYQGVFNDGNATMIQLKPPPTQYPVVFNENGLGNQTSWSVTLNGTTLTSQRPDIVFEEPNGTYLFTMNAPLGFNVSPSQGTLTIDGRGTSENIRFRTPWITSTATVDSSGRTVSIEFTGNATVLTSSVLLSTDGGTTVSFSATEIGPIGVLNVTIPKSAVPSGPSALVYVDGVRGNDVKIQDDEDNYYLYFLLPYGTHSVQLQFARPPTLYWNYIAGGALASGILMVLFLAFRLKPRRRARPTPTPVRRTLASSITLNNRSFLNWILFTPWHPQDNLELGVLPEAFYS